MLGVGAISVDVFKSEPLGFRSTSPRVETGRSGPCEVGHDPNPEAVEFDWSIPCERSGQGALGQDTWTGEVQTSQKVFYQRDPCEAAPVQVGSSPQSKLGETVPGYLRLGSPAPSAIPGTKVIAADYISDGSLIFLDEAEGAGAQERAESASSMPEPAGLEGSVCFVPGSQVSTIERLSGVTSGAMLPASGTTSCAMPQVSGSTSCAMPPISGVTSGAMPQVSGVTPGAMPQVSEVTPGVTCKAMSRELGATSDEEQAQQEQGSKALVSDAEALEDLTDSASSLAGPMGQQGGYTELGPKLKSLRFSLAPSPAMQTQSGQTQLSERQSNEIVRGIGNVNLLLGYERVGRGIVSLMGGEEASLYSLGTSSVATMYRVAGAIRQEVARCSDPKRTPRCSQDQSVVNLHMGSRQAAFDPPSQVSSVRSIEGSPEVVGDCRRPDVEAQEFPCNHLVWYVLLKEGALREYAGSQGIGQLVIGSEGLNTLGWGLGVSSRFNGDSQLVSGSDSQVSPPMQSPQRSKMVPKTAPKSPVVLQSTGITCPHFAKGFCRYGNLCKFLHQDGSESSAPVKDTVSTKSTEVVCKHFAAGWCRWGDQCKFAHSCASSNSLEAPDGSGERRRVKHRPLAEDKKEQLRQAGLLDVCFRWAQGNCDNASCRFSHRHINAWESRLFEELLDCNEASPTALPREENSAPRVSPEQTSPLQPESGLASSKLGVSQTPMPLLQPESSSAWNDLGDPPASRPLLTLEPLPAESR